MGKEISQQRDYSERTAIMIDEEVKSIVETAHQKARTLLTENVDKLHRLAKALLDKEILDGEEINKILAEEESPASPSANSETGEEVEIQPKEQDTGAAGAS